MKLRNTTDGHLLPAAALALTVVVASVWTLRAEDRPPYLDAGQPQQVRVEDLLQRLTLDEKVALVTAEFDITNTGKREGAEVAQVFVTDVQSSLPRPVKELKGFKKVALKPGEKQTVSVPLNRSAFAFYDPDKKGWLAEAGDFKILVGSSSRDIRLEDVFKLALTTFEKQ